MEEKLLTMRGMHSPATTFVPVTIGLAHLNASQRPKLKCGKELLNIPSLPDMQTPRRELCTSTFKYMDGTIPHTYKNGNTFIAPVKDGYINEQGLVGSHIVRYKEILEDKSFYQQNPR